MIGELLSGSSPPSEFFAISGLIILPALYGAGAIIVRELTISWNKGWGTIWLLGAAYGVIEEGVMVKSWFDPNWVDLGILGSYGRWLGVNWIWAFMLTLYHASVSISIPILLLDLIQPELRGIRITGKWSLRVIGIIFLADVILGFVLFPYHAPPVLIGFALIIVVLLFMLARTWPAGPSKGWILRRASTYFFFGFVSMVTFYVIYGALPHILPWPLLVLAIAIVYVLIVRWFLKSSLIGSANASRDFWLVAGVLGFFIFLSPFQEIDKNRIDNPAGMTVVGLAFLVFLALVYLKVRRIAENWPIALLPPPPPPP